MPDLGDQDIALARRNVDVALRELRKLEGFLEELRIEQLERDEVTRFPDACHDCSHCDGEGHFACQSTRCRELEWWDHQCTAGRCYECSGTGKAI